MGLFLILSSVVTEGGGCGGYGASGASGNSGGSTNPPPIIYGRPSGAPAAPASVSAPIDPDSTLIRQRAGRLSSSKTKRRRIMK